MDNGIFLPEDCWQDWCPSFILNQQQYLCLLALAHSLAGDITKTSVTLSYSFEINNNVKKNKRNSNSNDDGDDDSGNIYSTVTTHQK